MASARSRDAGGSGLYDIFLFVPFPLFLLVKPPSNAKRKKNVQASSSDFEEDVSAQPWSPRTWSAEVSAGPARSWGRRLRFGAAVQRPDLGPGLPASPAGVKPRGRQKGGRTVLCSAITCKWKRCPLDFNSRQRGYLITGYDKLPRDTENSIRRSGEWNQKGWGGLEDGERR